MNELQISVLYLTLVINSLLRQGTWYKIVCSHLFRCLLWHSNEELKKTRWFKAVELKDYCKRDHSVWRLMFIARPSPLLEQDAKQRENFTPKKHCRVAHSSLCISQTWWDISLKLWSNPKWPLRGNIYVLSCLPGRTVNIPPPSSALLHVKVFGDPQEFSRELISLWQVPMQWNQNYS